ncbi:glycoside hydrolase family 66 protein [Paenibacillus aurantiacus]|uniref:Glycoside hydrolase family 66 protein n=1 Tax=Paenibacillus aurantiacus TaxID=1936118 RepID=A0ABV5KJ63_9BACL
MKMKKTIHRLLVAGFAVLLLSSLALQPARRAEAASTGKVMYDVTTDKSMYNPGATVEVRIDLKNRLGRDITGGSVELRAFHLEKQIGTTLTKPLSLGQNADTIMTIGWTAPSADFQGYLLEAVVRDNAGAQLDSDTVGVDVSSTWTKFPRYGYLWDFTQQVDTAARIDALKNYHINALQYYDWFYRHQKPVAPNTDVWDDWSGRLIYGNKVKSYISQARAVNMVNMAYNMVYAATNGYDKDNIDYRWGLQWAEGDKAGQQFSFKMADSTPTGITTLYFFDLQNAGWRNYIFNEMNKAFLTFGFDGWHGDSIGEWGKMKDAGGNSFYVKDTFTPFLNAAKQAIGSKYLAFNPVGAQGIENVNRSSVDVLYTEIWPWDKDSDGVAYDTYASLRKEIEQSRRESGGKSLIVPAYMEYDYANNNPGKPFNTSAVLLTDAAVYASGGSRFELGDNGNMLSSEYFPKQNLYMDADLKQRVSKLYDFIVAYENLLRDGQEETANRIEFPAYASSGDGQPNRIWAFGKKDSKYDIVHTINLLGVSRNDWRAADGRKETPSKISNFEMKYYTAKDVNSVWLASPDANDGRSIALTFSKGSDSNGNYVRVQVPSLAYWNMIYFSGDAAGGHPGSTSGELINGTFEDGESGWLYTGTGAHGVDANDAYAGSKYWLWSDSAYTGKVEQTVNNLPNGSYTVSARVKQNLGSPSLSRMELSDYGGSTVYVNIPHGDSYVSISGTATVTNGTLKIAFYQAAPGSTNLQIDDVKLSKLP